MGVLVEPLVGTLAPHVVQGVRTADGETREGKKVQAAMHKARALPVLR